jgi:hypothetical protein
MVGPDYIQMIPLHEHHVDAPFRVDSTSTASATGSTKATRLRRTAGATSHNL